MPFDDLELEFEDEDEHDAKKKKNEAVHVDVDLEFNSPEAGKAGALRPPERPAAPAGTVPHIPLPQASGQPGSVRKIEEARVAQAQARPQGLASGARPANAPQPRSLGTSPLKEVGAFDLESQQLVEMREQIRKVEFKADVKVQVAEFKVEILSEMLSDMKLVEHQITQLLIRINAKHPDLKNEALMIKKILADFTAKKRK